MEDKSALVAFAALAQETRLQAIRSLVCHAPEGLAAGQLARLLGVPSNTLSSHLNVLAQAGLVTSERQGRTITYRAQIARLGQLARFLLAACCEGRPQDCAPDLSILSISCDEKEHA